MATTVEVPVIRAALTDYDDQWKAAAYLGFNTVSEFTQFLCSHGFIHFFIRFIQNKPSELAEDVLFSHIQTSLNRENRNAGPLSAAPRVANSVGSAQVQQAVRYVADLLITMVDQLCSIGAIADLDADLTDRAIQRLDEIYGVKNSIPKLCIKEVKMPRLVGDEERETVMEGFNRALVCLEVMGKIMSEHSMRQILPACLQDTAPIPQDCKPWFMQEEVQSSPERVSTPLGSEHDSAVSSGEDDLDVILEQEVTTPPPRRSARLNPTKEKATESGPSPKIPNTPASTKKKAAQPVSSPKKPNTSASPKKKAAEPAPPSKKQSSQRQVVQKNAQSPEIIYVRLPNQGLTPHLDKLAQKWGNSMETNIGTTTKIEKLSREALRQEVREVFEFKKWKVDFNEKALSLTIHRKAGKKGTGEALRFAIGKRGWSELKSSWNKLVKDSSRPTVKIVIEFEVEKA